MYDRRDFLKTTGGTLAALLSQRGLSAWQIDPQPAPDGPSVGIGVVGLGTWGREILTSLSRLQSAKVAMVCDLYRPAIQRAADIAPGATAVDDFRRVIDSPSVEAIVVAT